MKKIIIADTNIIINLCLGSVLVFLCELDDFEFIVTKEVEGEIKQGRARNYSGVKDQFYTMYNQEKLMICELNDQQVRLLETLRNDHSIGLGEASSIAYAYDIEESFFACEDGTACGVAEETLGSPMRIIRLEDLFDFMLQKGFKSEEEIMQIKNFLRDNN